MKVALIPQEGTGRAELGSQHGEEGLKSTPAPGLKAAMIANGAAV